MKIIVLNPQLDAMQQVSSFLEQKGVYAFCVGQAHEVLLTLQLQDHQVDLLVLQREGAQGEGDPGVHLLEKLKQNPEFAHLPVILTTRSWTMQQCAVHQQTAQGAHAYLSSPFEASALWNTIQAVFGLAESSSFVSSSSVSPSSSPAPVPSPLSSAQKTTEAAPSGKTLEDVSLVFTRSELSSEAESSIQFEQPAVPPSSSLPVPTLEAEVSIPPLDSSSVELGAQPPQGVSENIPTLVIVEDTKSEGGKDLSSATGVTSVTSSQSVPSLKPAQADLDAQAAQEMPYLYRNRAPDLSFTEPVGDAIVPGGVAQSPDLETFKHYLLLREQDVAILSAQLKAAQEQIQVGAKTISEERSQNGELLHLCQEQKKKIDELEEKSLQTLESREKYIQDLQFQLRVKADEVRHLERETQKAIEATEQLKERVRIDIRKIRTREKELENRLEIMKKDSEAMISTRETTIIELKRQLDLLEFNMDLVQVQFAREKELSAQLKERLSKASQAVRLVEGLLESQGKGSGESLLEAQASERKEKAS